MTNQEKLNLITIGYAKRSLVPGTRERKRMEQYAESMDELHIVVFTRKKEGFPSFSQTGNLFLYATNTNTKVGILLQAYLIVRKIIKADSRKKWVVSSQDPFETSLVGRLAVWQQKAVHHVQIHGDVFNPESYKTSIIDRLRAIYGRYIVRRTKAIRVVSERIKSSLLLSGVDGRSITVLPIHSDSNPFLSVGQSRQYITNQSLRFLYVGRFSEEKNITLLIEAFAVASKNHTNVTLDLVGDGQMKSELTQLIKQLELEEKISFLPWSDDISEVMATHDVLCLSSNHEGWGMVLLEAAAAGMPVITTDVGCAGTCVINNHTGRVAPVKDKFAFSEAIESYLSDSSLVKKHGIAGHELSKQIIISETNYIKRLVDSYYSSLG